MSEDDDHYDDDDMERVNAWLSGYCAGFENGILQAADMLCAADSGPFSAITKRNLIKIGEKLKVAAETLTKREMEKRVAEVESDLNSVRH